MNLMSSCFFFHTASMHDTILNLPGNFSISSAHICYSLLPPKVPRGNTISVLKRIAIAKSTSQDCRPLREEHDHFVSLCLSVSLGCISAVGSELACTHGMTTHEDVQARNSFPPFLGFFLIQPKFDTLLANRVVR